MGLFDTIILKEPFTCTSCGNIIINTQTKAFSNTLSYYQIGDIVKENQIITGIIKEDLFCEQCHDSSSNIYITLWNSLLTGIYYKRSEAEKELFHIDSGILLNHILRHQEEAEYITEKYNKLANLIRVYYEYCESSNKDTFFENKFMSIACHELKEFVNTGNPLKCIVESLDKNVEDDT